MYVHIYRHLNVFVCVTSSLVPEVVLEVVNRPKPPPSPMRLGALLIPPLILGISGDLVGRLSHGPWWAHNSQWLSTPTELAKSTGHPSKDTPASHPSSVSGDSYGFLRFHAIARGSWLVVYPLGIGMVLASY